MPSGKTARPHITDNKDGTITIKYQPTERGLHEMDIKYDGNHIPGWGNESPANRLGNAVLQTSFCRFDSRPIQTGFHFPNVNTIPLFARDRKPSAVLRGRREQRSGVGLRSRPELRHGQQSRHLHCGHQECGTRYKTRKNRLVAAPSVGGGGSS